MEKTKTPLSNFKLIMGVFAFTLLFNYLHYHDSREHFLSSFSRALLLATFSFYYIQISLERQNTIFAKEFNAKQRRIALSASLFTATQIIMTSVFEALLYHKEINWFKTIRAGLVMAALFFIVTFIHMKYLLKKEQKGKS
jgi:hypothetical protein